MLAVTNIEYDSVLAIFKLTLDNGEVLNLSAMAIEEMLGKMPMESEVVHTRNLIEQYRKMRDGRWKDFESLDKLAVALDKELEQAQKDLMNCAGKICIDQQKAVIDAIRSRKAILQERRHLLKLTHIEEGALRVELAKLTKGSTQAKD